MPELRLARITPANIDTALAVKVRPDQEHFVSPVAKSLAEAYVHGETAWPRLILDEDGTAVGFLMTFLDIDWNGKGVDFRSGLWRLNVVPDAQGRGVGRFAVSSVADELRRRGVTRMYVTWHPGDDGPEGFYRKLGFELTGETSGGQTVGVLHL
ncbi:acetyltransferase [[Actinomadura] parvosata subsp. kistnae]|uniref:GNAT family N-acetyltransferase n=1 Tax=[Actinomadura] parvosata subsp. kistnae TaxID=1909395 RepID=A0A1V0AA87_9ACTN|nr:GNAT family N-acetyltransferase [Nonomuraea sp. ATCC 55076]AQZ67111.1 GNAT family N-acetyltransferase [Nonomuraea sp. ATCC 55076]SPL94695.1 acetyltransferase [Actinomadura parvosata subsp. kistnae]